MINFLFLQLETSDFLSFQMYSKLSSPPAILQPLSYTFANAAISDGRLSKGTSVFVRIIAAVQTAVQAPFSFLHTEIAPLTGFKVVKIVYIDLVVPNKLLVCISPFSLTRAQPWS